MNLVSYPPDHKPNTNENMKQKPQISPSIISAFNRGFKTVLLVIALTGFAAVSHAQIGGTGWSSQTVSFNVQWPYATNESSRYFFTNNIYHCLTYSNDSSFEEGSTTLPRTEMRFNPDFTNGEIQYQAVMMIPANENSYCIMQDHTGDAQSPTYGPVAIMFIWLSKDGGSIWNGYTGTELATNLAGQWFQLNVDHNIVTHTIMAWINKNLVVTEADNGATDYYFKTGVYEQNLGTPSLAMNTYVTNSIKEWTSSGNFSGENEIECVASSLAANVAGGATTNGAPVIQYPFSGSANSLWTFIATTNGYYQINNVQSGKDMVVQGASTAGGAKIVQWTFGSSGDDQWKPVLNSDGTYTLYNLHSGLVLDDPSGSLTSGTQFDQWAAGGGSNQKFDIIQQ